MLNYALGLFPSMLKLDQALNERFPDGKKEIALFSPESFASGQENKVGDHVIISNQRDQQIVLKKVGDKWMVDLGNAGEPMPDEQVTRVSKAMNQIADRLKAGEFKSKDEATSELYKVMIEAVTPATSPAATQAAP